MGVLRNDPLGRILVDRNGSRNRYVNEYGIGDVGIWVKVGITYEYEGLWGVQGYSMCHLRQMTHSP